MKRGDAVEKKKKKKTKNHTKDPHELEAWLKTHKLRQYTQLLRDNDIVQLEDMKKLKKPALQSMGVKAKHARMFRDQLRLVCLLGWLLVWFVSFVCLHRR